MEVTLRKSLVLEIKKTQTNKTSMASKQNLASRHIFVSFGAISLKSRSSFSPFNLIKQKARFEMFLRFVRNQTYRILLFLHIPLPYIIISEIGIRFLITDLVRTKFMFYRYSYFWFVVSMKISTTLKNTFNQTSIFFQKLV